MMSPSVESNCAVLPAAQDTSCTVQDTQYAQLAFRNIIRSNAKLNIYHLKKITGMEKQTGIWKLESVIRALATHFHGLAAHFNGLNPFSSVIRYLLGIWSGFFQGFQIHPSIHYTFFHYSPLKIVLSVGFIGELFVIRFINKIYCTMPVFLK